MKDKIILTDCDGVLLDWEFTFDRWMQKHGYKVVQPNVYSILEKYGLEGIEKERLVRMFNESAWIRKLPPLRDAIKYVKKLHRDHGFIFHCISSLSNDDYAQHLRTKNLIEMFGPTVFDRYVYLDTGADKNAALLPYAGSECFWIEDKPENADLGVEYGLVSLLVEHDHNKSYSGFARPVRNWKEIYDVINQYC